MAAPCVAAAAKQNITVRSKGRIQELRYKVAIRFRVEGDLRFISHHDTMRLFERALSRAQLPVRFSEGFNPRPRMSLPLPRPVGVAALADVLVVELREAVDASEALARLRQQMPAGLVLLDAFHLQPERKLHPERVDYEVDLPEGLAPAVRQAVERVLSSDRWIVERTDRRGNPLRSIDIRPLLVEVSVEPGVLRWSCRVPDTGSARPGEWLLAFGLDPAEWLHRVRRTAVAWEAHTPTDSAPEPAEAASA